MSKQNYSDDAKATIGGNIARILQLRRAPGYKPRRWQTTWGSYTGIGIFELVRRFGTEIEGGLPMMHDELRTKDGRAS